MAKITIGDWDVTYDAVNDKLDFYSRSASDTFLSVDSTGSVSADDLSVTNAVDAGSVSADEQLNIPTYATRNDVPSEEGLYRVNDVDGSGRTGVILRVS